jgi:vacuolar-type H+-ATPase subunit I/STV1
MQTNNKGKKRQHEPTMLIPEIEEIYTMTDKQLKTLKDGDKIMQKNRTAERSNDQQELQRIQQVKDMVEKEQQFRHFMDTKRRNNDKYLEKITIEQINEKMEQEMKKLQQAVQEMDKNMDINNLTVDETLEQISQLANEKYYRQQDKIRNEKYETWKCTGCGKKQDKIRGIYCAGYRCFTVETRLCKQCEFHEWFKFGFVDEKKDDEKKVAQVKMLKNCQKCIQFTYQRQIEQEQEQPDCSQCGVVLTCEYCDC